MNNTGKPSKRKPHNLDAGYVAELIYKPSGSHIVIYKAAEQGIDVGGSKYAVVCSKHGTVWGETSVPRARVLMKEPEFCEQCQVTADYKQSGTCRHYYEQTNPTQDTCSVCGDVRTFS